MVLQQSTTLWPFMRQSKCLAIIAALTGNHQIIRAIRTASTEWHHMVNVVLGELLMAVVAFTFLSLILSLYILHCMFACIHFLSRAAQVRKDFTLSSTFLTRSTRTYAFLAYGSQVIGLATIGLKVFKSCRVGLFTDRAGFYSPIRRIFAELLSIFLRSTRSTGATKAIFLSRAKSQVFMCSRQYLLPFLTALIAFWNSMSLCRTSAILAASMKAIRGFGFTMKVMKCSRVLLLAFTATFHGLTPSVSSLCCRVPGVKETLFALVHDANAMHASHYIILYLPLKAEVRAI